MSRHQISSITIPLHATGQGQLLSANVASDWPVACCVVHVAATAERDDADYLAALENETTTLQKRVDACRSRIMMVTCFDVTVWPHSQFPVSRPLLLLLLLIHLMAQFIKRVGAVCCVNVIIAGCHFAIGWTKPRGTSYLTRTQHLTSTRP